MIGLLLLDVVNAPSLGASWIYPSSAVIVIFSTDFDSSGGPNEN